MITERMIPDGKQVLVAGTGRSGAAAARLLLQEQIDTVLFDGNRDLDTEKFYADNPDLKEVPLILGELEEERMKDFYAAVLSPGIPTDLPMVEQLRKAGVQIWGEVELAYCFAKGRLIAITGTNGKTTTTALTGEIMKSHYPDVRVVGNIGIPYTSVAAETTEETVTVAEISSFQLETIRLFRPEVSAILNITPKRILC